MPARRILPLLVAFCGIAACSGGGGGGGSTVIPIAQWGAFRHDLANTAVGLAEIDDNNGEIIFSIDLGDDSQALFHASPAVGIDSEIYVGTSAGLRAFNSDGAEQWRFQFCNLDDGATPCTAAGPRCIEVGAIDSTPAVTAGDDLFVITTSRWAFLIHDNGAAFTCLRAIAPSSGVNPSTRSSPQTVVDAGDQSLLSAFVGTADGGVGVFNRDGSTRWRFSPSSGPTSQLTSTPVIGTDIYITAPDGALHAIDFAGRPRWRVSIGEAWDGIDLVPSPVANVAVYAVTPDGGVTSFNSDGTFKWRFVQPTDDGAEREPIFGSPALVNQQVEDEDPDNPGTTIGRFETIVYVVNGDGTLYGVRDRDGSILLQDRCSISGQGCVTNADCPIGDETCERVCLPSGQACIEDEDCPDGETCGHRAEVELLDGGSVPVRSSVSISGDLFAIAGTEDGRLCARRLDGSTPRNEKWASGCVVADASGRRITSSPVMDRTSRVYVIAGGVLHAIE